MDSSSLDFTNWENANAKVEYLPLNGRGAIIRAILHYKNLPYTDVVYSFEEWGKHKKSGNYEFEQVPAFEFKGERFFQSGAITLMLARAFNLLGSNLHENYLHESLLFAFEDFIPKLAGAFFAISPEGKAQMETKKKELKEIHAPFFFSKFEERFKKYGGKYAVGDTFSLSDIIYTVMLTIAFKHPERKEEFEPILEQYAPTLNKHVDTVTQNEMADYYAKGFNKQAPI
jgi:glutathione S-transferase